MTIVEDIKTDTAAVVAKLEPVTTTAKNFVVRINETVTPYVVSAASWVWAKVRPLVQAFPVATAGLVALALFLTTLAWVTHRSKVDNVAPQTQVEQQTTKKHVAKKHRKALTKKIKKVAKAPAPAPQPQPKTGPRRECDANGFCWTYW